MILFLNN
jgi:WD40 repeat protein